MIDQRQPTVAPACLTLEPDLRRQRLALLLGGAAASAAMLLSAPAVHAQTTTAPAAAAPAPVQERSVRQIDPWQKMNRGFFRIHNVLDKIFIRPAAMIYRALTPGPIGKGAHNFLTNIQEPAIFVNDVLQLRFKRAGQTGARLVANTLAGVGGLIDVASKAGIPFHDNGFAITMGRYGVGPGPYLFVPLMGPSSVRDAIGTAVDFTLDPIKLANYPRRAEVSAGLTVLQGLDLRSRSDVDLEALFADATDPYATLRSTYLQSQQSQVEGRDLPGDTLPEFETIPSEPAPAGTGDQAPPPSADAAPTDAPQSGAAQADAPKADAAGPAPAAVSALDPSRLPRQPLTIEAILDADASTQPAALAATVPAQTLVLARTETPAWR